MKKYFYIISVFLLGFLILLFLKYFTIGRVICESQYGYCNDGINRVLASFEGKTYFKEKGKIKEYLKESPLVEECSFQFKLPSTLLVYLVERKPSYAVKTKTGEYFLVGSDAVILGKAVTTSLPYIETESQVILKGNRIDESYPFSLRILRYLDFLYGVRRGYIRDDRIEYQIQNGPLVVFPLDGDVKLLVGALRLIVQNVTNSNWEYSLEKPYNQITIDLRYKNPIIK